MGRQHDSILDLELFNLELLNTLNVGKVANVGAPWAQYFDFSLPLGIELRGVKT